MPFERKSFRKNPAKDENLIYGIHSITESIQAGKDINKILIQQGNKSELFSDIIKICKERSIPFSFVPREKFSFLTNKNHQGICAFVSPISYHSIENILPQLFEEGKVPFILILDRITDVRNFGAIARTAFCAGVHALVVPATDNAPVNDDAVKTSAGALMHIPVCREKNLKSTLEFLNQSGLKTIACSEKSKNNLHEIDLTTPLAIVMGNEETGISNDIIRKCNDLVKIPLSFGVQSLNVSVAAGIAMYEVVRQRVIEI